MRRSSAPSYQSLQPAKRGKFVAPFKANVAQSNNDANKPLCVGAFSKRTTSGLQKDRSEEKEYIVNSANGKICSDENRRGSLYFSVVWCKASRKKHKKWDGDGILLVHSKSVALKDLDGKDIGRSSGFKGTELENLAAGSLLFVGNKEVEIIDQIPQEVYLSGRCFVQSTTEVDVINEKAVDDDKALVDPLSNEEMKVPVRKSFNENTRQRESVAPRHSPCAAGAVVMPRPSASYLWLHNKSGRVIVDVVLDPYLCNHLRPHQVKGVTFLYKCVLGMGDFIGNGAILADEMGVGKTLQCIALIWTLLKQGPFSGRPIIKRCIIVVPGSLVKNWCTEFKKWLGNERIAAFPVGPNKRIDEFARSAIYPVMVVSYEMLLRYISDVQNIRFDLIICDEAHRLKNCSIKTTAAIAGLGIKRMVLLTGTPIQNDLGELYTLAQLCNPGIFGSVSSFRQVFENPIGKCQQPNCSKEEEEIGNKRAAEIQFMCTVKLVAKTGDVLKYTQTVVKVVADS